VTTQAIPPTAPSPAVAPTAPTSAPAPESTASSGAGPASRRERLEATLRAHDDGGGDVPLEQPAAPTHTPNPAPVPPQDSPPPAASGKLEAIQAKLQRDREARAAKQAQTEQARHMDGLQRQLEQAKQQPTMDVFVAEYNRNPAATLRKYNIDPRKHLDLLTQDAISPGSIEAKAHASDAETAGKQALAAIEEMRREQAAREQHEAGQRNNREFLESTASPDKFPNLSRLPETRRLRLALAAWSDLAQQGHAYDRDLVAEYVEAQLEEDQKHLAPAPPALAASAPTAPSRPTSATQASHVATKQPHRTITPELAGASSSAARPKTKAERKAALADRLVAVETD
jgi:hypothetical protein